MIQLPKELPLDHPVTLRQLLTIVDMLLVEIPHGVTSVAMHADARRSNADAIMDDFTRRLVREAR